ncbi:MAG: hypothetical protein ACR2OB_09005 [Solirubrobacteraceae bacterium]
MITMPNTHPFESADRLFAHPAHLLSLAELDPREAASQTPGQKS